VLAGSKGPHLSSPLAVAGGRRIIVADEDPRVASFVVETLRADGHLVLHAFDGLAAAELTVALDRCDLLISNSKIAGVAGLDLIRQVRERIPGLPIIYIANVNRSTPEIEQRLPADVPILREPFSADELRATVNARLPVS
jgi:DNA-binding response OmpR family regulator